MSVRGQCQMCARTSRLIPEVLSVCVDCIRTRPDQALPLVLQAHGAIRREFGLPPKPPRTPTKDGVKCPLCVNASRMGEGELGLCGATGEGAASTAGSPLQATSAGAAEHLAPLSLELVLPTPTPTPECVTACDCTPGELCDAGSCRAGTAPVYCCESDLCECLECCG